jgi:imidazolonepropionase-like amidohydrolase
MNEQTEKAVYPMKNLIIGLSLFVFCSAPFSMADKTNLVLFKNVKVFNGTEDRLLDQDVLVSGNLIREIGKDLAAGNGARVIDGNGMTLMPGLIDSHVHFNLSMDFGRPAMEASRWDYMAVMGAAAAHKSMAR